jgi:hypothetical protein
MRLIYFHHSNDKRYYHFINNNIVYTYTPKGGRSVHGMVTYRCDDTRDCKIQFCPPDDERMCSKHVEA